MIGTGMLGCMADCIASSMLITAAVTDPRASAVAGRLLIPKPWLPDECCPVVGVIASHDVIGVALGEVVAEFCRLLSDSTVMTSSAICRGSGGRPSLNRTVRGRSADPIELPRLCCDEVRFCAAPVCGP